MFFPLMKTQDLEGFCDLLYLPSNNWEVKSSKRLSVYALWSNGKSWNSLKINEIGAGEHFRVSTQDMRNNLTLSNLILLYPTDEKLEPILPKLPSKKVWHSEASAWRNTTGFSNNGAQTSYQSELNPLPERGSLITFHPFIQSGDVQNRLLTLNATSAPEIRKENLYIIDSKSKKTIDVKKISTNSTSTIFLDEYEFTQNDLPIFYCPKIACVPFGLGYSVLENMLSLEHTHPPSKFFLHGNRNQLQAQLKKKWIDSFDIK
jgi:hypothetical protein